MSGSRVLAAEDVGVDGQPVGARSEPAGARSRPWIAATRPASRSTARARCAVFGATPRRAATSRTELLHDPRLAVVGGCGGEHLERAPRRRPDGPTDVRGRRTDGHGDWRSTPSGQARRSIGQAHDTVRWSAARRAPSAAPGCTSRTAAPACRRDHRTTRSDAPSRRRAIGRSAATSAASSIVSNGG